ncbi:hypothetical protein [Sphingomonas sp.]|uniref:hypothetical protein n=1 Tax=Sphingomonas sp. TaxID=28214 RepID=UPI001ED299CF|nr:hypothetical protein [Sphingomonas sp.]MBX3593002.1 hypothetical protein [Sphingomonas sp.]
MKITHAIAPVLALIAGGGAIAQAGPQTDLFAYSEGTRIVQYPPDAPLHYMDASPLNLIDGSATTDWTGEAAQPAIFVFELAERTELSRVSFDTAGLNRDTKSPRAVRVEVSDTSSRSGFEPVLSATLRMKANGQSFAFAPDKRPVGRWVRLTVQSNYGDDYTGFTGFHGFGRQLTQQASMPDVTGSYEGWSGWGRLNLVQQGDQVTGCYAHENGRVSGVVVGRVLKLDMLQTPPGGPVRRMRGYFGVSPDGRQLIGIARGTSSSDQLGYATYMSADKTGSRAGSCG